MGGTIFNSWLMVCRVTATSAVEIVQLITQLQLADINESSVSINISYHLLTFTFTIQFCLSPSACLEGKDSYENMFDYMRSLNELLGGRKLSSGELFALWLGGEH